MNDLFDPAVVEDIKRRIALLHDGSERRWGTMSVSPTLAHCTGGMEMAMGTIKPERASFPAHVIGLLVKPLVLAGDRPKRRNSPSVPELFPADPARCEFEHERLRLLAAIDTFADRGAPCCSEHPHPFFGSLKPREWARLLYKHVDHPLRQFWRVATLLLLRAAARSRRGLPSSTMQVASSTAMVVPGLRAMCTLPAGAKRTSPARRVACFSPSNSIKRYLSVSVE